MYNSTSIEKKDEDDDSNSSNSDSEDSPAASSADLPPFVLTVESSCKIKIIESSCCCSGKNVWPWCKHTNL